jgi:hypothetical protein
MTEEDAPLEENEPTSEETAPATNPELVGSVLAEKYGFSETEILKGLREEAIKAFKGGERQKFLDLSTMYGDLGQGLVTEREGVGYPYGQLGLMLAMASIRRDTGRWQEYIEDLEDALIFCKGQGYEDAAINVELIITHAQEEIARLSPAEQTPGA